VKRILLHISGSWLIRVRLVHSWAVSFLCIYTFLFSLVYIDVDVHTPIIYIYIYIYSYVAVQTLFDGCCSTVQGLLDWSEERQARCESIYINMYTHLACLSRDSLGESRDKRVSPCRETSKV